MQNLMAIIKTMSTSAISLRFPILFFSVADPAAAWMSREQTSLRWRIRSLTPPHVTCLDDLLVGAARGRGGVTSRLSEAGPVYI